MQKARDAFFNHPLFVEKGIWDRNLFDGRMETQFNQAPAWGFKPRHGGALRVDFGETIAIERLVMKGTGMELPAKMESTVSAEVSPDLKAWEPVKLKVEKDTLTA